MMPAPDQPDQPGQQGDDEANEISVVIQLDTKTGEFSVGVEPEGQDEGAEEGTEDQWLKPAKDIDDALAQARELLKEPQKKLFDEYASKSNARLSQGY